MEEEMIALKSGYYFMIFNKKDIPFFDELEKKSKQIMMGDTIYDMYEALTWDTAQKVDKLMGNDELGYDIDEYLYEPYYEL